MDSVTVSEKSKDYITEYRKAELIIWFQDHAGEFLLQKYLNYRNLFVQRYCKQRFLELCDSIKDDTDIVFKFFARDFNEWCDQFEKNDDLSRLDSMENNIAEREKTFLNLVREVHIFTRHREEIAWSVKEIVDGVLCHMAEYEKNNHPVGVTIEEDLLDCLMYNIPDYQKTA